MATILDEDDMIAAKRSKIRFGKYESEEKCISEEDEMFMIFPDDIVYV